MIRTVMRVSWLNLRRDKVALLLTFILPPLFFTVFASVFSGIDGAGGQPVRVALWVEAGSPAAHELTARLAEQSEIKLLQLNREQGSPVDAMEELTTSLRIGQAQVGLLVPKGFDVSIKAVPDAPKLLLLTNDADPIAAPMLRGVLHRALLKQTLDSAKHLPGVSRLASTDLNRIETRSALGMEGTSPSIAFFAAGIGVMFLLFSLCGRSAILIEEQESGVLTRLRASRLGLGQLLLGRWLFLALLGFAQICLMFLWAWLVFGLSLWPASRLFGFLIMSLVTAGAAAGFAVFLATACRTRAQLNGIAAVLILAMSAVGGSMIPRFLMPESMQKIGHFTFNAWALDGYQKIFWYERPPSALWLECIVLILAGVVFLGLAAVLIRRRSMSKMM